MFLEFVAFFKVIQNNQIKNK